MSNLKVNSKSSILEFKRKHNELAGLVAELEKISGNIDLSKLIFVEDISAIDEEEFGNIYGKAFYTIDSDDYILIYIPSHVYEENSDMEWVSLITNSNGIFNIKTLNIYKEIEDESVLIIKSINNYEINRLEDIKDVDGHNRFIEGELELATGMPADLTISYKKWSLSGTHLQIVLAGSVLENTLIPTYPQRIAYVNLPEWIINKIYPISTDWLERKLIAIVPLTASGGGQDWNIACYLDRVNKRLELVCDNSTQITVVYDSGFRYSLDLLIDNESE